MAELQGAEYRVFKVLQKTTKRNPPPPFTTSKLQQEAIRKLRFTARKTMVVAQQLYEGIELEAGEPVGLITYMRTDSTRIAQEAAEEALTYIHHQFGPAYVIAKPRFFKNRKKAQDAHEAIRPTSVQLTPAKVAAHLSKDQSALYELIWKRFVASQMQQAQVDQNTISIEARTYLFTASGSSIRFPGFMTLYMTVDEEIENAKKKQALPPLKEANALSIGFALIPNSISPCRHRDFQKLPS